MNYYDFPSVLRFCAAALRDYAQVLKQFDDSEKDIDDVIAIYERIESIEHDYGSMPLNDLRSILHRSYRRLDDFVFMLREDDDLRWRGYGLLMTVVWGFVGFFPKVL